MRWVEQALAAAVCGSRDMQKLSGVCSLFNQLKRGLITRIPLLARLFPSAQEQLRLPSKGAILDILDRAPQDNYIEFNVPPLNPKP
jgi:hypothetical protein